MNASSQQQKKIALIATLVTLILVSVIYYVGQVKGKETWRNDQTQVAEKQEDKSPLTFEQTRQKAKVSDYLAYLKAQGQIPKVTFVNTKSKMLEGMTQSLNQFKKEDLKDLVVKVDDLKNYNSKDLLASSWIKNFPKEKSHLLVLPLPTVDDYHDGISMEDSVEILEHIYAQIRVDSPETNILFVHLPSLTQADHSDEKYGEYVNKVSEALKNKGYNVLDISQNFERAAKEAKGDLYEAEGTFTDKGLQVLKSEFEKALLEQEFDFSRGYKGDNEDCQQLEEKLAQKKAEEESRKAEQASAQEAEKEKQQAVRQSQESAVSRQPLQSQAQAAPSPNGIYSPNRGGAVYQHPVPVNPPTGAQSIGGQSAPVRQR